jgi:uncharacterized membrane protein YhaH (DUF805 family)
MNQSLADLFLTLDGRIDRRTWALGFIFTIVAGIGGLCLFNEAAYDESANAIANAPTMAAFVWAVVCIAAAAVLTIKRLRDRERPRALGISAGASAFALVVAWGFGLIGDTQGLTAYGTLVLATLIVPLAIALVECAS